MPCEDTKPSPQKSVQINYLHVLSRLRYRFSKFLQWLHFNMRDLDATEVFYSQKLSLIRFSVYSNAFDYMRPTQVNIICMRIFIMGTTNLQVHIKQICIQRCTLYICRFFPSSTRLHLYLVLCTTKSRYRNQSFDE